MKHPVALVSRPAARVALIIMLGGLWGAACGGESTPYFPSPIFGDAASSPDRIIAETASRLDVAGDAPVDAAGGGDGPHTADASSTGPTVTVTIETPTAGAVVASGNRFVPSVVVQVQGDNLGSADSIQQVTATPVRAIDKMNLPSTKLNQSRLEQLPGGGGVAYRFNETPVDLHGQDSGSYDLLISAKTVGNVEYTATVSFQVDGGPKIQIDTPGPGDGKFYKGAVAVDVTISDALFGPIQGVSMSIGQRDLPFKGPDSGASSQYTANIDFKAYVPPLAGEQLLTVRAKNKNGTETVAVRKFTSDDTGPTFANKIPKAGDLIGKVINVAVDVSDPAGVLTSSVIAVIAHGGKTFEVKLLPPAAGAATPTYQALFDTTLLPVNALYPTISFRASDVLGNETTETHTVNLDNTPPLSDLDPPDDFRSFTMAGDAFVCSWPTDPVGPDAVDDGDLVAQLFDIRARVEDQGNTPASGGADVTPLALADENRVQLLILDDTSQPLVVDTDGDKICDKINPLLTPTTTPMSARDALLINLAPVTPTGTPDTTADPSNSCAYGTIPKRPIPYCLTTYNPAKTRWYIGPSDPLMPNSPPFVTSHSDYMSNVISYAVGKLPAIWTIPPIIDNMVQCAGNQFDALANNLKDGWACMAVSAADKLGNLQVSRVLRVCIDHDGDGAECPHVAIVSSATAQADTGPQRITTAKPHGLVTGDDVIISRVEVQTQSNGHHKVTVVSDTVFTIDGTAHEARLSDVSNGRVVKASALPDCTGTQTTVGPPPIVTSDTPCTPWRAYRHGEIRTVQ